MAVGSADTVRAMSDLDDYEGRLRAEIAEAEVRTEAAYRELVTRNLHPMSGEYKMYQQIALTQGGLLGGLYAALALLTGEEGWDRELGEKMKAWTKREGS